MPSETSTVCADQTLEELRRELTEAHRREAATAEVLKVISRSPTDLQPVFDGILQSAIELCEAHLGLLNLYDGEKLRTVAQRGGNPGLAKWVFDRGPFRPDGEVVRRTLAEGRPFQTPDMRESTGGPNTIKFTELGEVRTFLSVPLLRDGKVIGNIGIYRPEVRPFTEQQINLVNTFAAQAVIAIESARLFEEVQARTRELQVALEQQTATSEVLGAISNSPGELDPVFQAMLANAVRICEAKFGNLLLCEDDGFRFVAVYGAPAAYRERFLDQTIRPSAKTPLARVRQTKQVAHVADITREPAYIELDPPFVALADLAGARSLLIVPMMREDQVVGAIAIYRQEVRPFADKQIDLLRNFAKQAVIAIENTRLLNELRESLQQQTATADVLKVISRSSFDLQTVLDTLVESAARLSEADMAQILRPRDTAYYNAASFGFSAEYVESHKTLTFPPGRGSLTGRVLLEGKPIQIPDVLADPDYSNLEPQRLGGYRTHLGVPLLRDGNPIGVILVSRRTVRPFDSKQIELVATFADQAVIAIENTRLFEAEQASKRELQESLQQQTATADVLKVISRSTFDLQTVLDTLVESAARLCAADTAAIWRPKGETFQFLAHYAFDTEYRVFTERYAVPVPVGRGSVAGRTLMEGRPVQVADVLADPEYAVTAVARTGGYRTLLGVPLMREGTPIGVITLQRTTVQPFTDKQIELLMTFADQAVIAIENTRLFEEVQERNRDLGEALEQQTATAEVLKVISRSVFDLQPVLETLVENACRLCGADKGFIYRVEENSGQWGAAYNAAPELLAFLAERPVKHARNSVTGRVLLEQRTIHVHDVLVDPEYDFVEKIGVRTTLGVPMQREGHLLGVIIIYREEVHPFNARQIELVETFADQAVIAIENVRLFNDIAQKSRELEIASQHKSQFVANMSHELRTPLAAILGYAELMQEGFYEPLGQKSLDALTRIRSNGRHLLGLINTVLDIAKIESGQFTLNMAEYAIESVVETVRSATESLAQYKKLALKTEVAKSLPTGLGDEQRLTQVLLNLVGNAIKFTDTGEVRVTAKAVNGQFNVSVTDTGPGIPAEHQTRIFDQFHQVDSSNTKAKGGTGLGLAIAKQIVEMHGGRIWVESTLGRGSTFQMELPTRAKFWKSNP